MRAVLLVKTTSMGDVIHNLPVVNDLLQAYPELAIDWVVEAPFAELAALHPGVRRVIPVAMRRWRKAPFARRTWREIGEFRRNLASQPYDLIIDTQGLLKSALISQLAQGPRHGYARDSIKEPLASYFYHQRHAVSRERHAVVRNRQLVAASAQLPALHALDYGLRPLGVRPAWLPTGPFVALLTATSSDDKLWPEARWIALGEALAKRGLRCILPAGNATERERAQRLAAAIPQALIAPPSSLTELAHVLANAAAVVGVDTGLTHLATALGRPTVALYTHTDPGLTGVYGLHDVWSLGGVAKLPSVQEVLNVLAPLLQP